MTSKLTQPSEPMRRCLVKLCESPAGEGVFDKRNRLVCAGEIIQTNPSTWTYLLENGYIETVAPNRIRITNKGRDLGKPLLTNNFQNAKHGGRVDPIRDYIDMDGMDPLDAYNA